MTVINIQEAKNHTKLRQRAEHMIAAGTMPSFTEVLTALELTRREMAARKIAKARAAKARVEGQGELL